MKLNEQIKQIRKKRGYSQEELAYLTGLSQQYISRIERGLPTTTDTLEKVCNALQVEMVISEEFPSKSTWNETSDFSDRYNKLSQRGEVILSHMSAALALGLLEEEDFAGEQVDYYCRRNLAVEGTRFHHMDNLQIVGSLLINGIRCTGYERTINDVLGSVDCFKEKMIKKVLGRFFDLFGDSLSELQIMDRHLPTLMQWKEKVSKRSSKADDMSFEIYKSNLLHHLKSLGDLDFLEEAISQDLVTSLFKEKKNLECLYTLALVDYLCRINNIELVSRYDSVRRIKLKEPFYAPDTFLMADLFPKGGYKERALADAIPEFLRHNIVEGDIRDVV